MTTVFENRLDDPEAFLRELAKDKAADSIQDGIIRLAYRSGPGTYRMLAPNHAMARTDEKLAWWFRARFVEASFLARGQLTKLSAYCGLGFNQPAFEAIHPGPSLVAKYSAIALETDARLQDLVHRLQTAAEGLEIRDGATYVGEDKAWLADPESPIEPVPAPRCATCNEPIYRANKQWRHQLSMTVGAGAEPYFEIEAGQAEGFYKDTCPLCHGLGETRFGTRSMTRCQRCLGNKTVPRLHHLADPVEYGRLV